MEKSTIIVYIWLTSLTVLILGTLFVVWWKTKKEKKIRKKQYNWGKAQLALISEQFKNRCYLCMISEEDFKMNDWKDNSLEEDKNLTPEELINNRITICYTCMGKLKTMAKINRFDYND
ncbi:hypothetical protein [endosymbiont GvMRE of Glomus versiforme]|uniref:hypothetical protein n=1 Tax=endosymbiont GvMRE of Glomus versiforme TaxID=2039283 RepID=UPI000EDC40B8|nr:hypothetical protein [endosymbiont GvMRE of Glomus versiforme]RHZ37437.1 hypothetical protein GvMRE_I1g551 [endosymbiont GvMRE of Glomus versiforme]